VRLELCKKLLCEFYKKKTGSYDASSRFTNTCVFYKHFRSVLSGVCAQKDKLFCTYV
jgi:hypothetical protein